MSALPLRAGAPSPRLILAALTVCAVAWSGSVAGQECNADGNAPAVPVPKCVNPATGAAATCGAGTVQLWPDGFQPGAQIPRQRDSTSRTGGLGYPEEKKGWWDFRGVKALDDRLFVAYSEGLQVWDIGGSAAAEPARLDFADVYLNEPMSAFLEPIIARGEVKHFFNDLDAVKATNGDYLIAMSGISLMGPSFWKFSNGQLKLLYRDVPSHVEQIRVFSHNGVHYAVGTGKGSGAQVFYNLSAAGNLTQPCIPEAGGSCPGVFLGKRTDVSWRFIDTKVVGNHLYLATSHNSRLAPLRIYRYALPLTSATNFAGAEKIFEGTGPLLGDIHSPVFFDHEGSTYLALVKDDRGSNRQIRVYDTAGCLDQGGCSSLGSPLWTEPVPAHWSGDLHLLTASSDGGTPYLYSGTIASGHLVEGPSLEGLYDLSSLPSASGVTELTAGGGSYKDPCHGKDVDYWSRYYAGNSNGLRSFDPRAGVVHDGHFYRVATSVLEVHVIGDGGGGGGTPHITTTASTSGPYWFGVPVPFSASASNCDGLGAWEWFSDNTTADGLESTASSALVTWSLCGSATCPSETAEVWAIKADCAGAPDLEETRASISLSDPRPVIISLDASPKATSNVFPVCTQLQFSADVGGRDPISRTWVVRAAEGGQEESLDSNTGATLTWDTSGVTLGLLIDGFESGDFSRWSSVFGVASAATTTTNAAWAPAAETTATSVAPKAAVTKDYEVLLNVTNAHGTDTESIFVTLVSLDAISFGSPAISVVDLGGGSYRFTAETSSATEWRWELEDPANGSDVGCLVYDKCAVLDFSGIAQTIEYAWTPPNTAGTFHVTATAINCADTTGISREISVTPAEITAPDPPTADLFAVDLDATPACTWQFLSGGNVDCPGQVGQPITFELAFTNATTLEFDWDGNGTWDETLAAATSVQHTYATAVHGIRPKVRAKSGGLVSSERLLQQPTLAVY